jgi:hypothetical protein
VLALQFQARLARAHARSLSEEAWTTSELN